LSSWIALKKISRPPDQTALERLRRNNGDVLVPATIPISRRGARNDDHHVLNADSIRRIGPKRRSHSFYLEIFRSDGRLQGALPHPPRIRFFFRLQSESPENGNFPGFGWRLLGMFGPKSSNIGLQRLLAMRKARVWQAFLIQRRKFSKTWNGERIRTHAFPIEPGPCGSFIEFGNMAGSSWITHNRCRP
jgi:hypothetical protein